MKLKVQPMKHSSDNYEPGNKTPTWISPKHFTIRTHLHLLLFRNTVALKDR